MHNSILPAAAGCTGSSTHVNLPPGSKLASLLGDCLKAQHATDTSNEAATRFVGACAMADASVYSLVLPWLESMMWTGQSSGLKMTAAAGKFVLEGRCCW